MKRLAPLAFAAGLLAPLTALAAPSPPAIDARVAEAMAKTGARGLAVAVIEDGRPVFVRAYGQRNAKGDPLTDRTVMYGASLTKTVFAYTVMQLVDEKKVDLDRPVAAMLPQPLPSYASEEDIDRYSRWGDLAGDERWRALTLRMSLTHSTGFPNFWWDGPDQKLRIHFEPGRRYAYSGTGIMLGQFAIERGLELDLRAEMQRRVFDRFGMTDTDVMWRPAFAANLADGWDEKGAPQPHDERSKTRAAGSMDTTIADMARFAAGLVRGEGLSPAARAEMLKRQLAITTPSQFPSFGPEAPPAQRRPDLAAGLGVVVFDGPQGHGFYKGGHDDITGNTMVCVERGRRCVVLLANDVRAEPAYPGLVRFLIGETGAPWTWEYGAKAAGW
ncbi:MAG: serine hydrolase [Caulobacterales bacterium 68-7]|nr:MAG: serine hydrolase [Caulobacterales bacterium 68-7]